MSDRFTSGYLAFLVVALIATFIALFFLAIYPVIDTYVPTQGQVDAVVVNKQIVEAHMGGHPIITVPKTWNVTFAVGNELASNSFNESCFDNLSIGQVVKIDYARGRFSGRLLVRAVYCY